jgi:hypothetical protein
MIKKMMNEVCLTACHDKEVNAELLWLVLVELTNWIHSVSAVNATLIKGNILTHELGIMCSLIQCINGMSQLIALVASISRCSVFTG